VSKEVEALKHKLETRRKVRDIPDSVEAARGEVVRCLRENDRRPLDCWREVEAFKEEVRRLEKEWVEKVVG
jgi:altered-inheritance-of-mitochondria protein 13